MKLAEKIFAALNESGAGLGGASIHIIEATLSDTNKITQTGKQNDILSPEEWIKANDEAIDISTLSKVEFEAYFTMLEIMQSYAGHVARRVARNVRHRACEIIIDHQTDMSPRGVTIINNVHDLNRDIMNIKIRDVYQAKDE